MKREKKPLKPGSGSETSAIDPTNSNISPVAMTQPANATSTMEKQFSGRPSSSAASTASMSTSTSIKHDKEPTSNSKSNTHIPEEDDYSNLKLRTSIVPLEGYLDRFKPNRSTNTLPVPSLNPFRNSSFGNKPNSIPSHSTIPDLQASFKRFAAFVDGNSDESTDEESDESEVINGKAVHSEHQVNECAPPKAQIDKNVDDSQPEIATGNELSGHDTNADPRESTPANEEDDRLPRFSRSSSKPASVNASSWPANVGIKRQISFLAQEPGGIQSGSGVAIGYDAKQPLSLPPMQQPDPFDVSDADSQDLLRTMDEVSNTVFGSTRPLPASKRPIFPGSGGEEQENGILTNASSDRRLTRSMSTPQNSQTLKGTQDDKQISDVVVYSSVHIPNDHPADALPINEINLAHEADLSGHVGDNIDVAFHGPPSGRSEGIETSSPLSELSRSPSPPVDITSAQRDLYHAKQEDVPPQREGIEPETIDTPTQPPPAKKRKMTGMTSTHFSPDKRARRKRLSTKRESDQTLHNKDEEHDSAVILRHEESDIKVGTRLKEPRLRTRASLKIQDRDVDMADTEVPHCADDISPGPAQDEGTAIEISISQSSAALTKRKRKSTGKRSSYFTPPKPALDLSIIDRVDLYNTTAGGKKKRVPAGTSTAPVPSIHSTRFGIIQEKLWQEPFWLLIAVTFLNKTTGRAAVPVFWALKKRYPTPEALANAEQEDLQDMIYHLGLQGQRSKRLISIAKAWVERPAEKGVRFRTLHYPSKGDGKAYKPPAVVEEDADECAGALEIGHIPGCGPYAWDSWRIFCRDVRRGLADDYNCKNAKEGSFEPEWQKVLPLDKELRACLRWMWLREGWIWDHRTGNKREATEAEMERAVLGEMEIRDPQERKFAAQAAGVEVVQGAAPTKNVDESLLGVLEAELENTKAVAEEQRNTPEQTGELTDASDNIVVTSAAKPVRRSARLST